MPTYFERVVLKSVDMPKQESYTIEEATEILDIPIEQVLKFGKNYKTKTGKARLKIEDNNEILFSSFVEFFGK